MSIEKLKRLSRLKRSRLETIAPEEREQVKPSINPEIIEKPISAPPKKVKEPAVTVSLEHWFKAQISETYGQSVITKRWGVKERTLAKKLVNTYGKDMTEQVIKAYVEAWPSMVLKSRNRLFGLPTINFLWSAQDQFFGAHQVTQPAVNSNRKDEYQDVVDDDDSW